MSATITLHQIFGAYVNQTTLEEAATWMAASTKAHPELADEFIAVLKNGCAGMTDDGSSIIDAVNRSGYRVDTKEEAVEYCQELMNLYLDRLRVSSS
jgi:hypothetical protein